MKKIKVMQLGSPTGMYGAERWILALVRHLDPEQVESIVAVVRDEPSLTAPLCQYAANYGFRTWICEAHGRVNWSAVRQIREYIIANNIDVLHTHAYKADLIGLFATRGLRCKLVTTPHGWSTGAGFMLRIYEALDRAIFPWFDAVVPLSEKLYQELQDSRRLQGRLHLISNGVDIAEIDAVTEMTSEMLAWRAAGDFVVGYIGQMITRKGLDVLLEAFARLNVPNKRLAMIGEGPQRAELELLAGSMGIADRVQFFGFRDDRLSLLKGFHAFVLPSRLEGIPRCLMESMAAGVPVVSSDIPGSRDLVDHDRTGWLFKLDDVAALTHALQRCTDPAERDRVAVAGRSWVLEHYSAAAMAGKYQQLFNRLLAADTAATKLSGARGF